MIGVGDDAILLYIFDLVDIGEGIMSVLKLYKHYVFFS